MDRHLKERLVGAAVLIAAAIILIPEMLSGPREGAPVQHEPTAGTADASGVKTYTIDLSAAKPQSAEQPSTSLQPFVETAPEPPPKMPAESARESAAPVESASKQAVSTQPSEAQDISVRTQPAAEKTPAEKHASEKARASAPLVATPVTSKSANDKNAGDSGVWAVQVASFSARATSERIAGELKAKGYPAFVTAFAVKGQTMYRVRVGPVEDRAAADTLLKKIKPLHPGAAVVAQ